MRCSAAITQLALMAGVLLGAPLALADASNLLLNGGAEEGKNGLPSIWYPAQVPAEELRMWQDMEHARSGKACLAISNQHEYDQPVSNNWAQELQDVPAGKAVRLTLAIRTENSDATNACVQCWAADGQDLLAFASTPVLRGTYDWMVLRTQPILVPPATASVVVRAALTGKGKAFFDDMRLEVTGATSHATSQPSADRELDVGVAGRVVKTLPVTKDCMILSYLPTWNHGNLDNLAVGDNEGGVRTLVAWESPSAEEIARSELKFILAMYSRETKRGGANGRIQVHEILSDWEELTSWESQPPVAPEPVASFDFIPNDGWKLFDLTRLLREQARNQRRPFGVMLRFKEENLEQDWSGYSWVSRESLEPWGNRRPRLLLVDPGQGAPASEPAGKPSESGGQ